MMVIQHSIRNFSEADLCKVSNKRPYANLQQCLLKKRFKNKLGTDISIKQSGDGIGAVGEDQSLKTNTNIF